MANVKKLKIKDTTYNLDAYNADSATKLATARTISLSGDVSGSASFDGSQNTTITTTVADDSHNHIIDNVDGLQTALNGKAPTSHASSSTTYGASSASNYGHAMASSTTPKANGTAAVGSETAKFARGDHVHPLQTTVSGNAGTATKLATARSIALGTGAVGTATNFDGSSNITIPVTSVKESYLDWGGKSISGGVSPVGASLSSEHSANRLAYLNPNALSFEYSDNGGSTWSTLSVSNDTKIGFVTTSGTFTVGNATPVTTNHRSRVTITAQNGTTGYVYTRPRKLLLNVSSPHGLSVLIETKTGATNASWNTVGTYPLSGWSGWNDIPLSFRTLGGSKDQTSNIWYMRLTFATTSVNSTYSSTKASIIGMRLFGDTCWIRTSNMGETGHLYSYDTAQNATFPASVNATSLKENGTALSSKYAVKSHTHSVTAKGSISNTTAGGSVSSTFTGTAHNHTFTGSAVTSGKPDTTNVTTIYSITGVGSLPSASLSSGTLPSCSYTAPSHSYTAPSLSGSVSNQCLTLTWSPGSHSFSAGSHSFSAGEFPALTFNAGSLPTRSSAISMPNVNHTHSVTASGTVANTTATGSVSSTFTGTAHNHTFTGSAVTSATES